VRNPAIVNGRIDGYIVMPFRKDLNALGTVDVIGVGGIRRLTLRRRTGNGPDGTLKSGGTGR
jgi:hypothetical protein